MIIDAADAVNIPIIAVGGVNDWQGYYQLYNVGRNRGSKSLQQ